MKRNKELARLILKIIDDEVPLHWLDETAFKALSKTHDVKIVAAHLYMLVSDGYIAGKVKRPHNDGSFDECIIHGLTWAGYDLLEALTLKQKPKSSVQPLKA